MMDKIYTKAFYENQARGALASAKRVLPPVLALLDAKSVVDVGCGCGAWTKGAADCGIADYLGIDGAHVDAGVLLFDAARFRRADLEQGFALERRFDLAMCLEVAEHLAPAGGDRLVAALCAAAPAVLFSAAYPGQGGTHHVNERWPGYWRERFARHQFIQLDAVRPALLNAADVETWYRTNAFLYVHRDLVQRRPELAALAAVDSPMGEELVVVPRKRVDPRAMGPRTWLKLAVSLVAGLPSVVRATVAGGRKAQARA